MTKTIRERSTKAVPGLSSGGRRRGSGLGLGIGRCRKGTLSDLWEVCCKTTAGLGKGRSKLVRRVKMD